jgi:hypothetical protein
MKQFSVTASLSAEDRFGRQVAACLDATAEALSHDISERLRVARRQALGKFREERGVATMVGHVGGGTAALGGGDDENRIWPSLVSLIPLLALAAGLVAIQLVSMNQRARELAEIDVAILVDDLPPDAYADPGFSQFLKVRLDQTQ